MGGGILDSRDPRFISMVEQREKVWRQGPFMIR